MTDAECAHAFSSLEEFMRSIEMGWVTTEVDDRVVLGLLRPVHVSERAVNQPDLYALTGVDEEDEQEARRSRGPEFTRTTEYTPCERLRLLLDAIEQALVRTGQMEREAVAAFSEIMNADGIKFEDRTTVISPGLSEGRIAVLDRLTSLLGALRAASASGE